MPTRKPKRANWRQRAESAEAQVEQLIGDIQAVSRDYTDAKKALESAERHNAELLKEREAKPCCGAELTEQDKRDLLEWWDERCNRAANANKRNNSLGWLAHDQMGLHLDESVSGCTTTAEKSSWLRRHWVELTVMAVVLGAIGFVVWRAWH